LSLTVGSSSDYVVFRSGDVFNASNSHSKIKWNVPGLSLNSDLGSNLLLGSKFVSLNSANLPDLNTKANVTINGINCGSFYLRYYSGFASDLNTIINSGTLAATEANIGGDCMNDSICKNVLCSANTLTFEAQHFDGFGEGNLSNVSGTGSNSGNVSINLTEEVSILVKYNIAYGEGLVDSDKSSAMLDSSSTNAVNGTWTYTPQYLYIENDGTVNISVNVTSSKNAASFLGGTSSEFKARGIGTESGACAGTLQTTPFEISTASQSICSLLKFGLFSDSFNVSTRLLIPSDAPSGYKESVLTFTATKV
jgi:hypothetical protein